MANKNGAAAPTTLEEWLNGRPSWLRMAASTVIQHRRMPNEEEMEALADHCLAEAAKKLDFDPCTVSHFPSGTLYTLQIQ